MSVPASLCLSLLLSSGPHFTPPSPSEQSAVADWLNVRGAPSEPEDIQRAFENWQLWKNTTLKERESHLALELKQISPPQNSRLISLNPGEEFRTLSQSNLTRMKSRLEELMPVSGALPDAILTEIAQLGGNLEFHYFERYGAVRETGVNPPLVSVRELNRMGITRRASFYSKLVGGSSSVPFQILATAQNQPPVSLNSRVPFDAIVLKNELARQAGFVSPNFDNSNALIHFFAIWEPEQIEILFNQNRLALPNAVNSVSKFLEFLDPRRIRTFFPDDSAYERLAVLRERLSSYVLTEADAGDFLRFAFVRNLTKTALDNPVEFARIKQEFGLPSGVQAVFARRFSKDLGLDQFALRIPKAVGPQSYTIVRMENQAYRPFPDYGNRRQPPWDSRRLDHDSKP